MPFAEDVVQESLLRLWRKPDILEQASESARAWLFTVARNLVIDDRRSARFTRELQSDNLPERASLDAIGPRSTSGCCRCVEVVVVGAPERCAPYYLGQTVADIAAHEQIPDGTVESRLATAARATDALQERGVGRD